MDSITINNSNLYDGEIIYNQIRAGRDKYTPYQKWITRHITAWGFKENKDFWTILSESTGGKRAKKYYITIELAKHLCIIDKSDIGMKVRDYYINIENKYRQQLLRDSTKITRRELTDIIKDSGENDRMHGHAYFNYTMLIYRKLGIEYTKTKNFRDTLTPEQLKAVENLEKLAETYIKMGYDYSQIKNTLPNIILDAESKLLSEGK
jgi:phage anti-repressor protein